MKSTTVNHQPNQTQLLPRLGDSPTGARTNISPLGVNTISPEGGKLLSPLGGNISRGRKTTITQRVGKYLPWEPVNSNGGNKGESTLNPKSG